MSAKEERGGQGRRHGPWRLMAERLSADRLALASLVRLLPARRPRGSRHRWWWPSSAMRSTRVDLVSRLEASELEPPARHRRARPRPVASPSPGGGRVSLLVGLGGGTRRRLSSARGSGSSPAIGARAPLDAFLMRVTDGVIALPLLPLLIVLAAVDPAKLGLPGVDRRGREPQPLPHHRRSWPSSAGRARRGSCATHTL